MIYDLVWTKRRVRAMEQLMWFIGRARMADANLNIIFAAKRRLGHKVGDR